MMKAERTEPDDDRFAGIFLVSSLAQGQRIFDVFP
jgi:hypothetical protein